MFNTLQGFGPIPLAWLLSLYPNKVCTYYLTASREFWQSLTLFDFAYFGSFGSVFCVPTPVEILAPVVECPSSPPALAGTAFGTDGSRFPSIRALIVYTTWIDEMATL